MASGAASSRQATRAMPRFRHALPQLDGRLFLADGGMETTLIFLDGLDLPDFAVFDLLRRTGGRAALERYIRPYAELARRLGTGFILDSATWRASADWGTRLGYTPKTLADANREAIAMLEPLREEFQTPQTPVVLNGCVWPRGDGYSADRLLSVTESESYHREQIDTFVGTEADMVSAITMNYVEEAIGITQAARQAAMPVVIFFTVETDGRLPTGQTLQAAVDQVDAATDAYPAYFMINCAHPTHFDQVLETRAPWLDRLGGLRANASRKSHAELDESTDLDDGDPSELGRQYAAIKQRAPRLNVLGGCCGTDHRHIEQIAATCGPLFPQAD